jgi:hypothetical protein
LFNNINSFGNFENRLIGIVKKGILSEDDLPIAHCMFNITVILGTLFPSFWILNLKYPDALPSYAYHVLGVLYFLLGVACWMERFMLGLHYSSHKPLFSKRSEIGRMLNAYPLYILCPLFGVSPGMYNAHHCKMHHTANNSGEDISATEQYQRDNPFEFFKYWFRFYFKIHFELFPCVIRNEWVTKGQGIFMLVIHTCYMVGLVAGMYSHPVPTFYTLVLPNFFAFFAMSIGNFGQHIFVDPEKHDCNYRLSYNIMSSAINQNNFNDGYHVIHHYNSQLHWSKLPSEFMKPEVMRKHYEKGAFTFFGDISFLDVTVYVISGNLRSLIEKYYVHIGPEDETPTVDEVVAEAQRRSKQNIFKFNVATSFLAHFC